MGRYLSPKYDQVMLVSGYSVLTAVNNMNVQYQDAPRLPNCLEIVRLKIGCPVVRTDGPSGGRCTVPLLPNFLGWIDYT